MMISLIIVITIANIKERESFYVKLSNIIIISKNNPSLKEDSYYYFEPRKTTSKTMTNTQIPSTKDMTNINDTYYDDILEFSCSYDYLTEKKYIDNNPYTKAVIKDYRNCLIIMWEYISEHNFFFTIFLHKNEYDLITLHLSVFIFYLTLSFALNALFFNNEEISSKYKGKLNYANTLLRAFSSFLLSVVLLNFINLIMNYSMMIHTLIVEIKEKRTLLILLKNYLKKVRIRIVFLFYFEILSILFLWYYMSTFCAVYHGSQIEWFKGGWISFLITILFSIVISFSVCILRYCGLYYKSRNIYNISIFFKKLLIGS